MQGQNVGPIFPIPPCLGSPANRVAEDCMARRLEEVEAWAMGRKIGTRQRCQQQWHLLLRPTEVAELGGGRKVTWLCDLRHGPWPL